MGLQHLTLDEKARLLRQVNAAKRHAGTVVDFSEAVLEKIRNGKILGKVVFLGRNAKPIYESATLLARKHGIETGRMAYIDLPSDIPKNEEHGKVFRYLLSAIGDTKHVTFVDDGGFGRFIRKLRGIINENSGGKIEVSSFQLLNLTSRKSWILERPHKAVPIVRALNFLAAQLHSTQRPKRLVQNGTKLDIERKPTSDMEQAAEREVLKVIRAEAKKRL